jgi:hypothetical protein
MLTACPVKNAAAFVVDPSAESVTIRIKREKPWYMVPPISWAIPMRSEREVVLDRIGTQIWKLCDNGSTVEAIVDAFSERHTLTFHEARAAVTGYLKGLIQRGVLAIVVDDKKALA